jgi:hypothetical protein
MNGRIALASGDSLHVVSECTELVLAVPAQPARTELRLSAAVRRIQITGHASLTGLALVGEGQRLTLVSGQHREIAELSLDRVLVTVSDVDIAAVGVVASDNGLPVGVRFTPRPSGPLKLKRVWADTEIVAEYDSENRVLCILGGQANVDSKVISAPSTGPLMPPEGFSIDDLSVARLTIAPDMMMCLGGWMAGARSSPVKAVISERGTLRLRATASIEALVLDAPRGTLSLDGAVVSEAFGELRTLTTNGPCVLKGAGLRLVGLRCNDGADISGLIAEHLDAPSLSHASKASSFDVVVPKDHSWRGLRVPDSALGWWRDSASWRALYQQLETKGSPAGAAWARRMEREARRRSAPLWSMSRLVLAVARLLDYGESVLRPLVVQTVVVVLSWLLILVTRAYPAVYETRDVLLMVPRLYLAPLRLFNNGAFVPPVAPSVFDSVAWTVALMSGILCFATAALAVRRKLAYS